MERKRYTQMKFRCTEAEHEAIMRKVEQSGKSQQEYLLAAAMNKKIVNTDGQRELAQELSRIGNNLNQIARRCNSGGPMATAKEIQLLRKQIGEVWQSLK